MARKPLPDHYGVLEIREDADELTIKKAYRRLVLQWHPDRNPADRETAEEKIRFLNIAYETVTNPIKRETYDLQRHAASRKRKASAPRSAPRVEVPKEFMMTPFGHPECFVRSLGRRVVVHSRSDDPDANFQSFFGSTKLALWWLPEVNNMCRIRKLGSKARGDKRGAAAGRAGGLNMAFDPQKAKKAGAEGSEVRMAPANKGQKAESVNFVTKASPTCEGALRFESASQRGQYLAFFPPCHLRVVPFLEDAEERVLDFLFVDFESMFKFITLEEVLEPIFSESPGAWIDLAKLRDDEAVKSHFKEVMGKEVWDVEDFQAYFEGHWATFEYNAEEQKARMRPKHERLAKQLRATPKAQEVVAAVSKTDESELHRLPVGALARALTALAKVANAEENSEESTSAQIQLLAALRVVGKGDQDKNDIPPFELLHSAEKVLELGGDDPDDTVLVQRSAAARILANKALEGAQKMEGGMIEAGFTLPDVVRFLLLPGAAGRDVQLATSCPKLFEGRSLKEQREVLHTAKGRNSSNTAAAAGTALLKTLSGGVAPTEHVAAPDVHVDSVREVADCGVRLPAAAALLRRMAPSASPLKLAEALLVMAARAGPGQADDIVAISETLASKEAFQNFPIQLILDIVLASSKDDNLQVLVRPAAQVAATVLTQWPFEEMVKLLLSLARRHALLKEEVDDRLRSAAEKCFTSEQFQLLGPNDLAGMVLATLGHGWSQLHEVAGQELLRRLPHFPAKELLMVSPVLFQKHAAQLIGAWPKVLAGGAPKDPKAADGLLPDQLVQLARLVGDNSRESEAPDAKQKLMEDLCERLLPKVTELSANGRAQLSQLCKTGGANATHLAKLQKSLVAMAGIQAESGAASSRGKRAAAPAGPDGHLSKKQRGKQLRKQRS